MVASFGQGVRGGQACLNRVQCFFIDATRQLAVLIAFRAGQGAREPAGRAEPGYVVHPDVAAPPHRHWVFAGGAASVRWLCVPPG